MSCVMDYLEIDKKVDVKKVVVIGYFCFGKIVVWVGVFDLCFVLVIFGNLGCCGVVILCCCFGEIVEVMNVCFFYWFCGNYK